VPAELRTTTLNCAPLSVVVVEHILGKLVETAYRGAKFYNMEMPELKRWPRTPV
jgi:hypothetical protein